MADKHDNPRPLDLGDDPMDPHGDGTIREGDPVYHLLLSGNAVVGNRREDGLWDVEVDGQPVESTPDTESTLDPAAVTTEEHAQERLPANALIDYIQQNRWVALGIAVVFVFVLLVLFFGTNS